MTLKQSILDCIPPAYYEDGTEAKCWIYKICDMFDVNSQSFKVVKETKDMVENEYHPDFGKYNFLDGWIADQKKIDKEFED